MTTAATETLTTSKVTPTADGGAPLDGDLRDRTNALLDKMAAANDAAAAEDPPAGGGEPGETEEGTAGHATPPETPAAKKADDERRKRLEDLQERGKQERARLKVKRGIEQDKQQLEHERSLLQQEIRAAQQARQELEQRLAALNPDDPNVLRRVLETLGGDAVSEFILSERDPSIRAKREADRASRPKPGQEPNPLEAEVKALRKQIDDMVGAQVRARDEAAFQSRLTEVDHDDGDGAPLAAAYMRKSPEKAFKMAYAIAHEWNLKRKVYSDDHLIAEMESQLREYAELPASRNVTKKEPTPRAPADTAGEDEPNETTAATAPARTNGKPNVKPVPHKGFQDRVRNAKRVVSQLSR